MAQPDPIGGDLVVHCIVADDRTIEPYACLEIAAVLPLCPKVQIVLISRTSIHGIDALL